MRVLKSTLLVVVLLFASSAIYAAAPAGAWWDGNYTYRQQISVAAGASALVTAYATSITFNHAAQVSAGHSIASGDDVRVVYWNGTTWIELDRVVDADSNWNSSTTTLWFQTQTAIASGGTDDNYYLYYGFTGSSTPSSTTPLEDTTNIFLFYDDFSSATLDTTVRWTNNGATQSTGLLTLGNGKQIRSQSTFGTDTIWETRAQLSSAKAPSGTAFYYWAANNSANYNYTSPYLRFYSTTAVNHTANDSLAGTATQTFVPTTPTAMQLYAFTREGTTAARFLVNGTQVASFAHGASNTALRILLRNDTAAGQTQQYQWTRVRPYRNPEPSSSLGAQATFTPTPVAAYSFEESSYSGTTGEVKDSSTNILNGTAHGAATTANTSPAVAGTAVGTCRYLTLNGTNSFLEIPNTAKLNMTTAFSFAAWVRHHTNSYKTWETVLAKGDSAYRIHLNGSCTVASVLGTYTTNGLDEGLNAGCTTADMAANQVPVANQWYHVGATFRNGEMRIYVNGNLINSAAYSPPTIATNTYDLAIGENLQQTGRFWDGDIDEVTIWDEPVGQSTIQANMAATHACGPPHFVIVDDGAGINCAPETITVYVRDIANNAVTTYNQGITLDTTTGKGDWSLVTGSGVLANGVANDGIATYQWPLGESSATFSLSYKEGPASTPISVYQTTTPTIKDDGTAAAILWSPSGFTVTSSALSNPPPNTIPAFASPQIAGTSFPVYLTAYGTTPTDSTCGVIEAYTGAKNLKFWSTYVNPTTGTRTVSINGGAIATAEGSAASQAVTFTNGQASVTALYKDAGSLAIGLKDTNVSDPNLPNGIRGSTGTFVSRPSTFVLSNIKRTDTGVANPGATSATGAVFLPAGQAFSATVTALESGGTATPNFGKEIIPESVGLTSNLVLPSPGQNPAIVAATGFGAFTNGVASGTDFSWSEVGILTLTPHIKDGDYLGIGDVVGTVSGNVGRFIPYNFGVTQNTPAMASSCGTNTGPDYLGQPLTYFTAPVLSLTARALGGATTQNYQNTFFKLTSTSSNNRTYVTSLGTLDQSGLPANDPTALSLNNGLATLTFNTNSGVAYVRTATPVAPFTPTLTLSLNILDSDGVAYSSSTSTLSSNPFTINTPSIATPEQRYGRMAFRNAVGSELINLPLPLHAEYFLSTTAGFVENTSDSCTTGVSTSLAISLNGGTSCLLDTGACTDVSGQHFQMPPLLGDFNAILKAPGVGHTGTVTVTATVPAWLQYNWNAAGFENPIGIATFGIYQGEARRIFQIEK